MTLEAVAAANALREQLEKHGRLDFDRERPPSSSSSRADAAAANFSTRPLLPRSQGGNGGPGRMLGVCLCEPGGVVLRAFSGQLPLSDESGGSGGGGWACPGWAGPVAALTNDAPEYARCRRLSDALTRRIEALKVEPVAGGGTGEKEQRQGAAAAAAAAAAVARLRGRRRAISRALIARVQDSYASFDLLGRPLRLRQAYLALADGSGAGGSTDDKDDGGGGEEEAEAPAAPLPVTRLSSVDPRGAGGSSRERWRGFPAGVGDCCAPKLLHDAALRELRPVAMAEFWFGAPPRGDGGGGGGGGGHGGGVDGSGGENDASDAGGDSDTSAAREGESKEAAWRRRQRRRVLRRKQGARRRAGSSDDAGAAAAAAATREHGRFYGPCEKCAGVLGAMLCDAAA